MAIFVYHFALIYMNWDMIFFSKSLLFFKGEFTSRLPTSGDLQSDGGYTESRTNGGPVENVSARHRHGDSEHGPEHSATWVHAPELHLY